VNPALIPKPAVPAAVLAKVAYAPRCVIRNLMRNGAVKDANGIVGRSSGLQQRKRGKTDRRDVRTGST